METWRKIMIRNSRPWKKLQTVTVAWIGPEVETMMPLSLAALQKMRMTTKALNCSRTEASPTKGLCHFRALEVWRWKNRPL
jgi:hypothetical protein